MDAAALTTTLRQLKAKREKLSHRRWVRLKFINQLISKWTRRWGSARILKEIAAHMKGAETIVDVACGTDHLMAELCILRKDIRIAVANDLDFEAVSHLKVSGANAVQFVNADLSALPFRQKFDVGVAKCVLHHANSNAAIADFLSALEQVAKKILVIEIEDPFRSNWRAFIWHVFWYRMVLADDGGRFFSAEEFKSLLCSAYAETAIDFSTLTAFKGRYLFAKIDFQKGIPNVSVNP